MMLELKKYDQPFNFSEERIKKRKILLTGFDGILPCPSNSRS